MAPRKAAGKGKATSSKAAASSAPKGRRSKLAKENNISAEAEAEIKEAWQLFSQDDVDGYEDEKEGVIETKNVKSALAAQGINPAPSDLQEFISILDPENEGYVTYAHFLSLSALQLNNRASTTTEEEVAADFKLFTPAQHRAGVADAVIRLADLREVAKLIKEDVSDDVLKAMINEANGGKGAGRGVTMHEFREIMVRAGMFQ